MGASYSVTIDNLSGHSLVCTENKYVQIAPYSSLEVDLPNACTLRVKNTAQLINLSTQEGKLVATTSGHEFIEPTIKYEYTKAATVCHILLKHAAKTSSSSATWMQTQSSKYLWQLTLPGTHNSGASSAYQDYHAPHILSQYAICQRLSITEMAHLGVRFFDFRVCDDTYSENIGVSHYIIVTKLLHLLQELQKFMTEHPSEVIIIWLKADPKCTFTRHALLETMIEDTLGPMIIRDKLWCNSKLGNLQKLNKRVLILTNLSEKYHELDLMLSNSYWLCKAPKSIELFENLDNIWVKKQIPKRTMENRCFSLTHCEVFKGNVMDYVSELPSWIIGGNVGLEADAEVSNKILIEKLKSDWQKESFSVITTDFASEETVATIIEHNLRNGW
jgi:hypothetical protein